MADRPATETTLLDRVEAYLRQHRIPATRFGKIAVGHPNLVNRMRKGLTFQRKTIQRIEAVLAGPPRPMTQGEFKARRYRLAVQENMRADLEERRRRLTDPVERAATYLRRRGFKPVCGATVVDGAKGKGLWLVGAARVAPEELLERARRAGWEG